MFQNCNLCNRAIVVFIVFRGLLGWLCPMVFKGQIVMLLCPKTLPAVNAYIMMYFLQTGLADNNFGVNSCLYSFLFFGTFESQVCMDHLYSYMATATGRVQYIWCGQSFCRIRES